MDIEAAKKDIDFAIREYHNPDNRAAVYNALHRVQVNLEEKPADTDTEAERLP